MEKVKKLENSRVEVTHEDNTTRIYVLNVKKNPSAPKLPVFKAFRKKAKGFAKAIDFKISMPPIYDQGNLGSCVSNATGGCVSYMNWRRTGKYFNISRLYNYFTARGMLSAGESIPQYIIQDSGLYIQSGCNAIKQYGALAEPLYPYLINKFAYLPPATIFAEAFKHKNITFVAIGKNLDSIKSVLTNKQPFIIGINVYENLFDATTTSTGTIKMPAGELLGGHAIVAVGYDDTKQVCIIRNSWGVNWGNKGYGTIPYAYLLGPDAYDFIVVNQFV